MNTEADAMAAVIAESWALVHVPSELRTAAVCLAAVVQHGNALAWVPDDLRTAELCQVAVAESPTALNDVPPDLRTAKMCLAAVERYWPALEYVPGYLRTAELCQVAVSQSTDALDHVPRNLRAQMDVCAKPQCILITRHEGVREWFRREKIPIDRVDAELDCSIITHGDHVYGTLPLYLIADVCARGARFFSVTMTIPRELRGKEYSPDQMDQFNCRIEEFYVEHRHD